VFAVILSSQPVFPVFLISFAGLGYGTGLTDTAWNAWASGTPRPNVVSGFLHGSFSLGCVVGPAIVTFALRTGGTWGTFYMVLVRVSEMEPTPQDSC
jgi:fucose permease